MAKKIAFLKSVLQERKFSLSVRSPGSSMCYGTREVSFLQLSMLYETSSFSKSGILVSCIFCAQIHVVYT